MLGIQSLDPLIALGYIVSVAVLILGILYSMYMEVQGE